MVKVCVLRIEGTNCEEETARAFREIGAEAELVHLKQLTSDCSQERKRDLFDYQVLMIPGGFSAGDSIRAGAIFAARMKSKLMTDLKKFVEKGRAVGGICNGFQVLVELGFLPGFEGVSQQPQAVLAPNINGLFECRPIYLKHENSCVFTERLEKNKVILMPVAHGEGRFSFGEDYAQMLEKLVDNKQIVFRYVKENGSEAKQEYPYNPNGALYDIAGISNPAGNVFGLMPHPERVTHKILYHDWTKRPLETNSGDGRLLFESVVEYAKKL